MLRRLAAMDDRRPRIAAIGDRDPALLTHREVDAAIALLQPSAECSWLATTDGRAARAEGFDGVWLLPGSPYRDDEAAYAVTAWCLRTRTPFLGTCAGFQYACVVLARELAAVAGAAHAEGDPGATDPVVQRLACSLYGETRTVRPVPGTRLAAICGEQPFDGFHWCGYGLAPAHARRLERAGVLISADAPDAGSEAIELPGHPFFLATAFQPQVGSSRAQAPHPLLAALVRAAAAHSRRAPT